MKSLLLLSLFAVAYCTPVLQTGNEDQQNARDEEESRVKRAKEVMMFGNQQNEPKYEAKRADHRQEEPNVFDDKEGISNTREPVAISQEKDDNEQASLLESPIEPVEKNRHLTDEDYLTDTDSLIHEYDLIKEPELNYENTINSKESDKDGSFREDDYSIYRPVHLTQYPYRNWYKPFNFNQYRYKRSQPRALNGHQMPHSRVLKRSQRIKRALYYPSNVYESQVDAPYEKSVRIPLQSPIIKDDLSYLLDVLDYPRVYDDEDTFNQVIPYTGYTPYEELVNEDYEPRLDYRPKRSKGFMYVPSIKMSRDLYPDIEDQVVPGKIPMKEYADAYERVMELAAALQRPNYSPEEYQEEEYRK